MWEDFFVGREGVAIKAAGREKREVGRLGVVCIPMLVVLFREVDFIRRGIWLEILHRSSVLFGLPWSFTCRRGFTLLVIVSHPFRGGGNLRGT